MKILILGGTAEARDLANRLVDLGHAVITSLAGRTSRPMLPKGDVRVGKFGGVPGLSAYLKAARIGRLIDATHPYAGLISINAVAAAQRTGVPLVRCMRPAWPEPPGWNWLTVPDVTAAARALPAGATAMITTGHEGLDGFFERDDCHFLVRLIEPPELRLPPFARLLLARPPYTVEGETRLFAGETISHLVSKNSGGPQTFAKLEAAHCLDLETIMIARPVYGPALEVETPEAAIAALHLATS